MQCSLIECPLPIDTPHPTVVVLGQEVFVLWGHAPKCVRVHNTSAESLEMTGDMPCSFVDIAAVGWQGHLITYGGHFNGDCSRHLHRFDTETHVWQRWGPIGEPPALFSTTAVRVWTALSDRGPPGMQWPALTHLNGCLYVAGGLRKCLDTRVWRYTVADGSWQPLLTHPNARRCALLTIGEADQRLAVVNDLGSVHISKEGERWVPLPCPAFHPSAHLPASISLCGPYSFVSVCPTRLVFVRVHGLRPWHHDQHAAALPDLHTKIQAWLCCCVWVLLLPPELGMRPLHFLAL
eukprot:NODE_3720_length_913_cov_22.645038_g3568_i0.p1 GENE.NODE_3720_length_913_cov_22.645038_g3568_i0~~NODE_3720_length_913_cov_22.645038_g3568_i0.p1  ORF type:complete len:293 (+),score=53.87 NODE_3720_length_913_cov_22.645038_g3568_i0:20-898(+)